MSTTGFPYEVTAVWIMDKPNLTDPASYEWPQHRYSLTGSFPVPSCKGSVKVQVDTYTVDSQADADYLAALTVLNSPADDARLHPHNYFARIIPAAAPTDCETPGTPTNVHTPSTPAPSTPAPSLPAKPKPVHRTTPKATPTAGRKASAHRARATRALHVNVHRATPAAARPLASTGVPVDDLGLIAVVLILSGAGLLLACRRAVTGSHK